MLEFAPEFFEEEVRDGFTIPAFMKNAWAAQLEMLSRIDEICLENDIKYAVDWGTLLGAVRHKGFIPWDDDIDICMKRADQDKFEQIVANRDDIQMSTVYNNPEHGLHAVSVVNTMDYTLDRNHIKTYHGFPFPAKIDIFTIDYCPRAKSLENEQIGALRAIYNAVNLRTWIEENSVLTGGYYAKKKEYEELLHFLEKTCGIEFSEANPSEQELLILREEISALYTDEDSNYLTHMGCLEIGKDFYIPKDTFDRCVRMPFENIMVNVPENYDDILRMKYGDDYMTPIQAEAGHDYPFYNTFIREVFDPNRDKSEEDTKRYVESISEKYYMDFLKKSTESRVNTELTGQKAAELEVLEEVKRLCDEVDVGLYAIGDTLISAVRDNDISSESNGIQLAIKRSDLSKLVMNLPERLDSWFGYSSLYSHKNHEDMRIVIYSDNYMCLEDEYAARFHEYNDKAYVYISIIDDISNDDASEEIHKMLVENLITTAKGMPTKPPYSQEVMGIVTEWKKIAGIEVDLEQNLKKEFLRCADNVASAVRDDSTKRVRITAELQDGIDRLYNRDSFADAVEMKFADTTICIPVGYDHIINVMES